MTDRSVRALAALALAGLAGAAAPADAQEQARGRVTLELNKVEPVDGACRIYLLLRNQTGQAFEKLQLELVSFDGQGVISQRVAVELGPLRADRPLAKLFDVPDTPCDRVSQLLVNEAVQCVTPSGPVGDCLGMIATASRASVTFLE
jgi:hypothetical protein